MMSGQWIRPDKDNPHSLWGLRDGIQVGLWKTSIEGHGDGGPRGLLRIGSPILEDGKKAGLVNFIAVEPIVAGHRGFSELEHSASDGKPGRLFWTGTKEPPPAESLPHPGTLHTVDGVETLSWTVYMERFDNGAQPVLDLQIRADRPEELQLRLSSMPGSAPMDYCIVTATMGNYVRLRQLHLRDGIVSAKEIWPRFDGREFTPDAFFSRERCMHLPDGDLIVCVTSDEADPHAVPPDPVAPGWAYRGSFPVTQYWRKPRSKNQNPHLKVRVNGRRLYWATHNPIPGGLAYENFDLVEPFTEGQIFQFGVTRRLPAEIMRQPESVQRDSVLP